MQRDQNNIHLLVTQFVFHIILTYLAMRLVIDTTVPKNSDLFSIYFTNHKVILVTLLSLGLGYIMIVLEQKKQVAKLWDLLFYLVYFIVATLTINLGYETNKALLLIPVLLLTIKYGTEYGVKAAMIYSVFFIMANIYLQNSDLSEDIILSIVLIFFAWALGSSIDSAISFSNTAKKLNHLNEELAIQIEKNSAVGLLAAGIAHEIRNPLTGVKGFIQHMRKTRKLPSDEILEIIENDTNRIDAVISDFLIFSKPSFDSNKEENLISTVNHCIKLIEPFAMKNGVNIIFPVYSADFIYTDHDKLKQVLINILKNAVEAFETDLARSNKIINVKVVQSQNEKYSQLIVTDNGMGMTDEVLNKLALPFFSTKDQGTGLGLMVSYKIIQSLGGDLQFKTELGKGTEVFIQIPKQKELQK